jgi:hypothetical protein
LEASYLTIGVPSLLTAGSLVFSFLGLLSSFAKLIAIYNPSNNLSFSNNPLQQNLNTSYLCFSPILSNFSYKESANVGFFS